VSMRILFADDSMTAQNMGKKILTEAGYDVVAVSNGAAAVKKIAEQKPDIVILDIYMPGYTGLEVCDKLRASVETLKTPVLLTVGKMEPYRAEDANRVRADGVIIKPFEASDLLAVIKKLEERVVPKTVAMAMADETILLERPPEVTEFAPLPPESHAEMNMDAGENSVPAIVDVPDNMATSAAFSDLLGPEPAHSFAPMPVPARAPVAEFSVSPEPQAGRPASTPEFPAAANAGVEPTAAAEPVDFQHVEPVEIEHNEVPEFTTSTSTTSRAESTDTYVEEEEAQERDEPALSTAPRAFGGAAIAGEGAHETAPASFPDTQPIPVYLEPEPELESFPPVAVTAPETMPETTSALEEPVAPIPAPATPAGLEIFGDDLSTEHENSAVFAAATMSAPESPLVVDSGSAVEAAGIDSFSAKVEAQIQRIESIVAVSEARHTEAKVEAPVENGFAGPELSTALAPPPAEDDFEARVAAAMSVYDDPLLEKTETPSALAHEVMPARHQPELTPEPTPEPASFETPYSFEYSPPVKSPEIESTPQFAASTEKLQPAAAAVSVSPGPIGPAVATVEPVEEPVATTVTPHEESVLTSERWVPVEPVHSRIEDEEIISEIAAQLPATTVAAVASAADPGTDTQMISDVVHRVLERLKPHLIEEISKELKSRK
jgi:CheY-like chemotaxis protein